MNISFRFLRVDSLLLLREVFKLRYHVYCCERGFLNPDDIPDGLEIDQYDKHSIHFAAIDSGEKIVGTIRMIMHSETTPFPIEVHCPSIFKENGFNRNQVTEISRLAVRKRCRKEFEENLIDTGSSHFSDDYMINDTLQIKNYSRKRHEIVLGLYKIVYHECKRQNLTHCFALMERKLWAILDRIGIPFRQIGEEVDYFGPVVPYLLTISELEKHIYQFNPILYKYFLEGIEPYYLPELRKLNQNNNFHFDLNFY